MLLHKAAFRKEVKDEMMQFSRYLATVCRDPLSLLRMLRSVRRYVKKPGCPGSAEAIRIRLCGRRGTVFLRRGTSDVAAFKEIFFDHEYDLPTGFLPHGIIDMGANIGLATLMAGLRFPEATIHSYEPDAESCCLLRRNCAGFGLGNVQVFQEAVLAESGNASMSRPDVHMPWAYSAHKDEHGTCCAVSGRMALARMQQPVDLLKIDIEGAEEAVLSAMHEAIGQIEVVLGEIHPESSSVTEVLRLLSRSHHVDIRKLAFGPAGVTFRATRQPWNAYVTAATS